MQIYEFFPNKRIKSLKKVASLAKIAIGQTLFFVNRFDFSELLLIFASEYYFNPTRQDHGNTYECTNRGQEAAAAAAD